MVSTSSIALQKAIIEEYVPFLSDVLLKADLLQGELKAVVRKGKEHFCVRLQAGPKTGGSPG